MSASRLASRFEDASESAAESTESLKLPMQVSVSPKSMLEVAIGKWQYNAVVNKATCCGDEQDKGDVGASDDALQTLLTETLIPVTATAGCCLRISCS